MCSSAKVYEAGRGVDAPLVGTEVLVARCDMRLLSEEEQVANARLIAAAPDLLESLRKCVTLMLAGDDPELADVREDEYRRAVVEAKLAIARAEGRNPQ